ncbi:MAG: FtsX-like permease family protein [Treponema sp.]|nr:FtsX-like permease family protein [Treponema sp.]
MKTFAMSLKSVLYRRKQYLSLMLVCVFGVGISLFCLFLIDGMLNALEYKAKIYYGGDLQFIGGSPGLYIDNPDEIIEQLYEVFPENTLISKRHDLDAEYAAFYFEGVGVRQRVIKGVDFDKEKPLFDSWNFVDGSADGIKGTNGVLLSEPIAKMLQVKAGDAITFLYQIPWSGQINTRELVVKGIFRDSSLFGMYTSYMDADVLSEVCLYPAGYTNRIVLFFEDGSPSEKQILEWQHQLEQKFRMFELTDNKQKFYDQLWALEMPTYALIKLSANLQDVQILIDAMKLIAAFIIIMLVIIIVAGVSSTFRVIVMKRINEIGIYKAIGMKRGKITGLLLSETSLLVFFGCIAGFVLSLILVFFAGFINLSFIPAFDIFLTNGVLKAKISFVYFAVVSIAVIVTTTAAVLFAIRKSVKITPCQALAVTE